MEKQFICAWDAQTYSGNTVQLHGLDFFRKEIGYTESDINTISRLNIGEFYYPNDITKSHVIVRITDSPLQLAQE